GHLSWGRTAAMLQFFGLYEEWLKSQGRSHSAIEFRLWATRDYCPGPFRAEMTLLSKPHLSAGQPGSVQLQVRNDSVQTWQLTPGTTSGIHLQFQIYDTDGHRIHAGHAGLFSARVLPGECLNLTLPVGALPPGKFQLTADLVRGPDVSFAQI